jgi:hypothetical protein
MTHADLMRAASEYAHLGPTAVEVLNEMTERQFSHDDLERALDHARRTAHLNVLTGRDLFAIPAEPQRMILAPILPRGRQGALYSGPGLGKSMMVRIIGGGIASAAPDIFGKLPATEPGGVALFVTNEEDEQEMRRGFAITAAASGYDLDAVLDNVRVIPLRGTDFTLADPVCRGWLESQIEEIRPATTFLDSVASLSGCDIKDDQVALELFRWGGRVTSGLDTTFLWTAHDRKENPNAVRRSNDLDDLFGSRQVSAQLDFAYRLLKSGEDRVLRCTKMRGAATPEDMSLEVISVPDQMFGMRCVTGMSRMSRESGTVEAVRDHLIANPGESMSGLRDTVARQLKKRPADVGDVVKDLLAEGFIENAGTPHRFKLQWTGKSMSRMSQDVPDTASGQHVRMSHPLQGGTRDMGHDPPGDGFTCACGCGRDVGSNGITRIECREAVA